MVGRGWGVREGEERVGGGLGRGYRRQCRRFLRHANNNANASRRRRNNICKRRRSNVCNWRGNNVCKRRGGNDVCNRGRNGNDVSRKRGGNNSRVSNSRKTCHSIHPSHSDLLAPRNKMLPNKMLPNKILPNKMVHLKMLHSKMLHNRTPCPHNKLHPVSETRRWTR